MEVINTWSEGLNKDIAKTFQSNKSYLDALNIRLSTEKGQSAGAIVNIKGNELFQALPTTSTVFTFVGTGSFGTPGLVTYTITINGVVYTRTNKPRTFEYLLELFNEDVDFIALGTKAWLSEDETALTVTGITPNPIITLSITGTTLTQTTLVPSQSNLIPIGYTLIRDSIFIYSTNETAEIPATTGGVGQIWKLTYDIETLTPTLTLLYNNYLNFTTFHPIPPTATEGNYENSGIQRIYWTDNFNPPRVFNTSDPDGFILDLSLLEFQTPADITIPILQRLDSGSTSSVKVGVYQSAFRLKNSSSVTTISELSDMVNVVNANENIMVGGANSKDYTGSVTGTNANKIIKWKISGLDTDFDRIEIFVIIRDTLGGLPRIILTHDEPIPTNGIFEFVYSGAPEIDEITLNEFLAFNSTFTHAKTMSSKHNYLLVGNTRTENIDFDFDARAYRFKPSPDPQDNYVLIEDSQGTIDSYIINTSTDYDNIPETHDAINPDSDVYKYKINSTTLGGTGKYIDYEFGYTCVKADSQTELSTVQISPFAYTNQNTAVTDINLGVNGQDYPTNSINDGIKYAYRAGLLKGYKRNETYRFAIQFFDKKSNPLFSRWIGDIKFPDYGDTCPAANRGTTDTGSTVPSVFSLCFEDSTNPNLYWVNQLYIKFNVTIPEELKNKIGGYRITRVERKQADKTILAAGLLTCVLNDGSTLYPPDIHASSTINPTDTLNLDTSTSQFHFMFDSPDFFLNGFSGKQTGDQIRVNMQLGAANSNKDILPNSSPGTEPYRILKAYKNQIAYNTTTSTANHYGITDAGFCDFGGDYNFTIGTAIPFKNYTRTSTSESASLGSTTLLIQTDTALALTSTYSCLEANYNKVYATYYRPNPNQYGGNTYSIRSRNNYIPCGSIQPILESTSVSSPFSHKIFGGDTFVDIYDNQKLIKNWGQRSRPQWTGASPSKESFTYFFPCESVHNFGLRHGIHMNNALYALGEGAAGSASIAESYDYNTVYSNENNIKTSLPKPLDFTSISENDTRFWISEKKIAGEDKDSWTLFQTNNWIDAESAYGPVNSMLMFRNEILFFQDKAFGILPINQRSLIQDNTLTTLQLGTGSLLSKPEYISTKVGSRHQWSTLATDTAVYFLDINEKNIYKYSSRTEPLTLIKGLSSFFQENLSGRILVTDNPIHFKTLTGTSGVTCVYDYRNNEVLYTFHDAKQLEVSTGDVGGGFGGDLEDISFVQVEQTSFTVAYSELFQTFTSFYSFKPNIYISDKRNFFTNNPAADNMLYIHNTGDYCNFYGTTFESNLKVIINPNPDKTKIFTNLEWLYEVYDENDINILNETWTKLRAYNEYQNTDYITLIPNTNVQRKERNWQTIIPRNAVTNIGSNPDIFNATNLSTARLFRERLRDKHLTLDLVNLNTSNNRFVFPLLKTLYQISPR